MLAAQLKEVAEIDRRIQDMHQELTALYQRRSSILLPVVGQPAPRPTTTQTRHANTTWAKGEYARLANVWQRSGVEPPSYRVLARRLLKARKVMDDLSLADRRLQGHLRLILIPPSDLLLFPFTANLRQRQTFVTSNDYVSYEFVDAAKPAKWRVLVVFGRKEGLFIRRPKDVIDDKSYMIAGYDTRALGVYEYAVFSLHQTMPIDQDGWVVLFREQRKDSLLPCATFTDGRFFFDLDDTDNLFGDNYFRPAVEV